eukprot:EG_transcript_29028
MVKLKKKAPKSKVEAGSAAAAAPLASQPAPKVLKKRKLGKKKAAVQTPPSSGQPSQEPAAAVAAQPKTCMRCGEKGHVAKECKYANKIHVGVCHAWMRHGCDDSHCKFHHWKEYRGCFLELWRRQQAKAKEAAQPKKPPPPKKKKLKKQKGSAFKRRD